MQGFCVLLGLSLEGELSFEPFVSAVYSEQVSAGRERPVMDGPLYDVFFEVHT